jgi:hypothetical protein
MAGEKVEGKENQELLNVSGKGLTDITDDIIASAERRVAQVQKIVELALKRTNWHDWVDQNGKPYLGSSGGEKVARLFGICWKVIKSEKIMTEDEKSKFYFYEYIGLFSFAGSSDYIEAVGTCSQKDQFFAKVGNEYRPLSEIDETNIKKSAYSNCVANGITRLLGIRNLTWEEVSKANPDITREKCAKIKYAEGGQGGGKISEGQRKRLFAISKEVGVSEEVLKNYLKENYKIEHTADIEKKDYDRICTWVQSLATGQ